MPFSRVILDISTNLPIGTLNDILSDSPTRALPFSRKVQNFFHALSAGARSATVSSGTTAESASALSASQTATFSAAATATDTVTVNGVTLTCVASSPANNQFVPGTSASASAANLAAAINASTTDALSGVVNASALAAVCTITCSIPGVIGNTITTAKSSSSVTLGGATLVGGTGRLPVLAAFKF